jgi:hypothetical protein
VPSSSSVTSERSALKRDIAPPPAEPAGGRRGAGDAGNESAQRHQRG